MRERCACLAKLVKNRLTLTEAYLVYYREERIKKSLGWLSPMEYRRKLGGVGRINWTFF